MLSLVDYSIVGGFVLAASSAIGGGLWKIRTNESRHLDEKLNTLAQGVKDQHEVISEKVDTLSADVQHFTGKMEGWDLDARVTRLERRQFSAWDNK